MISFGLETPVFSNPLYLDLGESVLVNDGSRVVKVYLRNRFPLLPDDLKSSNFKGRLTNLANNKTYEIPCEYENGDLFYRISSKNRKWFSLCVYRKDPYSKPSEVNSTCIRFAMRGYSTQGNIPIVQNVTTIREKENPLAVGLMQYHYWAQMGDEVNVSVSYKDKALSDFPVYLSAPDGVELTATTSDSGTVSFILPKIPLQLFEDRFDQLPVVVYSVFTEPNSKTRYVASESLMVHPRHYGGEYFKDARLWVLALMAAMVFIFLFLKRNGISGEDHEI
jgi:hypothetical protein